MDEPLEGTAGNGEQEEVPPGMNEDEEADPYLVTDPEEALSRIPSEMQPSEIHDGLMNKLLVPNLEEGGIAMFTDIVTIEAGADITLCTYLDVITDEITFIHDTRGSQTPYGHHAILQFTATPQEPGTRECTQEDIATAQLGQVLGGTGGEGTGGVDLPPNVVSEIPAGAQLVINHHWINYGEEDVTAQAQMITIPPQPGLDLMIARALTIVETDFDIAPDSMGEASVECEAERDLQILSVIGHQHEWGTHVRGERFGEVEDMLFDHDYNPAMVSEPLTTYYSIDEPYVVAEGDSLRMTCQWHNTSSERLTFPREMCVMFAWQLGADKDDVCLGGNWL